MDEKALDELEKEAMMTTLKDIAREAGISIMDTESLRINIVRVCARLLHTVGSLECVLGGIEPTDCDTHDDIQFLFMMADKNDFLESFKREYERLLPIFEKADKMHKVSGRRKRYPIDVD